MADSTGSNSREVVIRFRGDTQDLEGKVERLGTKLRAVGPAATEGAGAAGAAVTGFGEAVQGAGTAVEGTAADLERFNQLEAAFAQGAAEAASQAQMQAIAAETLAQRTAAAGAAEQKAATETRQLSQAEIELAAAVQRVVALLPKLEDPNVGGRGLAMNAARATVAMHDLEAAEEKARAAGVRIGPEVGGALARIAPAIDLTTQRYGKQAEALENVRAKGRLAAQSQEAMAASAGGLQGMFLALDRTSTGWAGTMGRLGLATFGVVEAWKLGTSTGEWLRMKIKELTGVSTELDAGFARLIVGGDQLPKHMKDWASDALWFTKGISALRRETDTFNKSMEDAGIKLRNPREELRRFSEVADALDTKLLVLGPDTKQWTDFVDKNRDALIKWYTEGVAKGAIQVGTLNERVAAAITKAQELAQREEALKKITEDYTLTLDKAKQKLAENVAEKAKAITAINAEAEAQVKAIREMNLSDEERTKKVREVTEKQTADLQKAAAEMAKAQAEEKKALEDVGSAMDSVTTKAGEVAGGASSISIKFKDAAKGAGDFKGAAVGTGEKMDELKRPTEDLLKRTEPLAGGFKGAATEAKGLGSSIGEISNKAPGMNVELSKAAESAPKAATGFKDAAAGAKDAAAAMPGLSGVLPSVRGELKATADEAERLARALRDVKSASAAAAGTGGGGSPFEGGSAQAEAA